jgi:hypothetical protein
MIRFNVYAVQRLVLARQYTHQILRKPKPGMAGPASDAGEDAMTEQEIRGTAPSRSEVTVKPGQNACKDHDITSSFEPRT